MAANLSDMETSIADQLFSLYELKGDLANNINLLTGNDNAKQTDSFESLVDKVKDLDPTDTLDTLNISENGTYTANYGEYAGTLGWKTVSVHVTDTSSQGGNTGPGSYGGSSYGAGGSYSDADMVPTFTVTFHKYPKGTSYPDDETAEVECEIYTDVTSIPISPRYCPEDQEDEQTAKYVFVKWNPEPINVQQNMDCYPLYEEANAEITDDWKTIVGNGGSNYRIGQWKKFTVGEFSYPAYISNKHNKYGPPTSWSESTETAYKDSIVTFKAVKVADASSSPSGATSTWMIVKLDNSSIFDGASSNPLGVRKDAGTFWQGDDAYIIYLIYPKMGLNANYSASELPDIVGTTAYTKLLKWENSPTRYLLNNYFINGMPNELKTGIASVSNEFVSVDKSGSNIYNYDTVTDKIWLPMVNQLATRQAGDYASFGANRHFNVAEAFGTSFVIGCGDVNAADINSFAGVGVPADTILTMNNNTHAFFCL